MSQNPSVNRALADQWLDHIDHALGRPIFPCRESHRNYFATDARGPLAAEFEASEHWTLLRRSSGMAYFAVTDQGRTALATHLEGLADRQRAFAVTFEGRTTIVSARSRGAARYARFLDVSDCCADLSFRAFAEAAIVRAA